MIIVIKIENAHRREDAPQTCACKKEQFNCSTREYETQEKPTFEDILDRFFKEITK